MASDLQFDLILSAILFSLLNHTIIFACIQVFHDFVCLNIFLHIFGEVFSSLWLWEIVSLLLNVTHILYLHEESPNLNDKYKDTHDIVFCEFFLFYL